jgi:hypothetical protein
MQGEDRAARISGNKFSTVESQRQQIVDMISSSAATLQRGPLMKRSNSTLLSIGEDHDQGKSFAVWDYACVYIAIREFTIAWGTRFGTKKITVQKAEYPLVVDTGGVLDIGRLVVSLLVDVICLLPASLVLVDNKDWFEEESQAISPRIAKAEQEVKLFTMHTTSY